MQLLEHFLLFTREVKKSLWDFQGFHLEEQERTQVMSLLSAMGALRAHTLIQALKALK